MDNKVKIIDGKYHVTADLAAQICGVTKITLTNWRQRSNPPPFDDKSKLYELDALGDWVRTKQIYKKGKGGSYPWKPINDPTPVTMPGMAKPLKEDQEERYKRLRADKLEMEIQEKAGDLVFADEVMIAMTAMVSRVKTRMLSVATSIAPLINVKMKAVAIEQIIEAEIRIALEELSPDWKSEIEEDQ